MKLSFQVHRKTQLHPLIVDIDTFIVAGWVGRNPDAIARHIEELAELGVPPPSTTPLFYRVAENQLTQATHIQVVGSHTSGEAEIFLFKAGHELFISLCSDHTDRQLEAHSVALSKQICAKPIATAAWCLADIEARWDTLLLRSYIQENGNSVLYQEGTLSTLRPPADLIAQYQTNHTPLPPTWAMSCGTLTTIGAIRPSTSLTMELFDPLTQRRLHHHYSIDALPVIA